MLTNIHAEIKHDKSDLEKAMYLKHVQVGEWMNSATMETVLSTAILED